MHLWHRVDKRPCLHSAFKLLVAYLGYFQIWLSNEMIRFASFLNQTPKAYEQLSTNAICSLQVLSITCIENKVIQNLDFKDVTSDFANATLKSLAYPLAYAYKPIVFMLRQWHIATGVFGG